jgi:hypothetical protein
MTTPPLRGRPRHRGLLALAALASLCAGCLDEPRIEDRWTRVDLESASLTPGQNVTAGTTLPIALEAKITYRAIVTGYAVAELRASRTVAATDVSVHPDAPRPAMASDIDRVLAGSVTRGRATRAITGWDHLMQTLPFAFDGAVPAATDSTRGLFLLVYLGSGERVELDDGRDSVVVTPFPSSQYQILPIGLELTPVTAGSQP